MQTLQKVSPINSPKKEANDNIFYVLKVTIFPGIITGIGMLDPKPLLDVYLATFSKNSIKILLKEKSTMTRVINTILGEANVEHLAIGGV